MVLSSQPQKWSGVHPPDWHKATNLRGCLITALLILHMTSQWIWRIAIRYTIKHCLIILPNQYGVLSVSSFLVESPWKRSFDFRAAHQSRPNNSSSLTNSSSASSSLKVASSSFKGLFGINPIAKNLPQTENIQESYSTSNYKSSNCQMHP